MKQKLEMHKFIQNKYNNSLIFVTDYNWPIEVILKGKALVIHINHLDDILNISKHIDERTKISAFVYTNEKASLETIDINEAWGDTPIILYLNRLGKFRDISHKINLLRTLNAIIIFTGNEKEATRDAQILSSLGIHTGIKISPDSVLSEHVLDLITYNFYSNCPHAEIEPFSTLSRYYDGESYVSPAFAYFENPERYIYIDSKKNISFTKKDLCDQNIEHLKLDDIKGNKIATLVEEESLKWQKYFIESHKCTFCPAFRICLGYFEEQSDKANCKVVMTELLDAIEFQKKSRNINKKERCQL